MWPRVANNRSRGPTGQAAAATSPLGGPGGPGGPGGVRAPFDQARYRSVLGHYATGVTVVAAVEGGQPIGLSVNSFTSVSLDPPLVSFCAAKGSSSWPRIRAAGSFSVNVLAEDQEVLSRVFATRGADKFAGVRWRPAPSGAPLIEGTLAWVEATVEAEYEAGDHVLVVGRVSDLDVAGEGRPLIYYRGGYGRFEP